MTQEEKIDLLKELITELKITSFDFTITEDTELRMLGLDSLDIVELQIMYEEKTNRIAADTEMPVNTVRDLINLMC